MFQYRVDDDLTLELANVRHSAPLFEQIDSNRKYLGRHLNWVWKVHSVTDVHELIGRHLKAFAEGTRQLVIIRYQGTVVGDISLRVTDSSTHACEMGYWLAEAYQHKGIMTRAVRAMIDYAIGELSMRRLVICCAVDNPSSCAIPQRLGFTHEGVLRQEEWVRDHYVDLNQYSLLATEWALDSPAAFICAIDDDVDLRLFEPRHTNALFALTDTNRDYLRQWLPWLDNIETPHDTRAFINSGLKQVADNNGFQAGIWYQGELVGAIGYHYWNFNHGTTEIGYWLAESYQGKGIMTKTVRKLVNYAFKTLALNRVEIPCATGNDKSCAIPQRLGFSHEGVIRRAEWLYDHFVDWNLYAILAADWT